LRTLASGFFVGSGGEGFLEFFDSGQLITNFGCGKNAAACQLPVRLFGRDATIAVSLD